MGTVNTDDKGNYTFSVECGKTYNVRAEKKIIQQEESVTIADENGKTNGYSLRKSVNGYIVGDDLGKCFGIKIYTLISINQISDKKQL
jgi:hypothetical protein